MYYYRYIARWEGFKGDSLRERMRHLGSLKKLVFVRGQFIHDAIQSQVEHHYMGREASQESAVNLYVRSIDKMRKAPMAHIVEAVNGIGVEGADFDALLDEGVEQLGTFFEVIWPVYRDQEYVQHERFDSFEREGLKVNVKIDLVTRNRDKEIIITDWKTGKEWEDPATNMQMSAYLMWASHRFRVPLDKVKGELVYLYNAKHVPATRTEEDAEDAWDDIKKGAAEMLSVRGLSDMPPSPSKENCRLCNFATYCPEGKRMLAEIGLGFAPLE